IVLGTGPLPGATAPEAWHTQYGSLFARNVTVATLTPFLPAPGKATGTAVIVAPGGGFRTLSMDNEGWNVARALAARGVAAFVLIRRGAGEWHVDPTRIGMVGFSAGAMLTMATTLAGDDSKPAFIGTIYGPLAPVAVPADAPPLFVALAADDPLFGNAGTGLI